MAYELLRIFYSLWMLGVAIFMLNAVSILLFGSGVQGKRLKAILVMPIFCVVWPLSLCSPEGRKVLFGKFHQL